MTDPTLLVLSSLADGPKHGYAMMLDIAAFAEVTLGPGTLYGAITRLEERGWIKPFGPRTRRQAYALTPGGRTYLREQMDALSRITKTASARLKQA
jgi:DNA-binding PadR family transcriptional regulator